VDRLKWLLPNVIDKYQYAFLTGIGLLYSVLIVNETIDYLTKEQLNGVIVEVDFEKAYDSLDWEFLM